MRRPERAGSSKERGIANTPARRQQTRRPRAPLRGRRARRRRRPRRRRRRPSAAPRRARWTAGPPTGPHPRPAARQGPGTRRRRPCSPPERENATDKTTITRISQAAAQSSIRCRAERRRPTWPVETPECSCDTLVKPTCTVPFLARAHTRHMKHGSAARRQEPRRTTGLRSRCTHVAEGGAGMSAGSRYSRRSTAWGASAVGSAGTHGTKAHPNEHRLAWEKQGIAHREPRRTCRPPQRCRCRSGSTGA